MRHVSLLMILLMLFALLLAGCTDNDTGQSSTPVDSTPSAVDTSQTLQTGDAPVSNTSSPVPTEMETQENVVIDVTGQPVIGGG